MTPRGEPTGSGSDAPPRGMRQSQRERLVAGAVASAIRDGYAGASVAKIVARAGVSRRTFYNYFRNADDCLLAALAEIQQQLLADVRRAIAERPPQHALPASLGALIELARSRPLSALFLTGQAMAGGPAALDARDRGLAEIELLIEEAHEQAPMKTEIPGLSPRVAVGGVYRLLASRQRRRQPGLSRVLEDLTAWVQSYGLPAGQRSRAAQPAARPRASSAGGRGPSRDEIAANQRKCELSVQLLMSATADAFFTGASWPERIWQAGRAFTGFLEGNPTIAHIVFIEAYAVGPGAVQRVEESHVTFTIFLQQGYQETQRETPPSRTALEAIVASVFELVYLEVRRGEDANVTGRLPDIALLALAPFLEAAEAERFVAGRLSEPRA